MPKWQMIDETLLWEIPFDGVISDICLATDQTWDSAGLIRRTIINIDPQTDRSDQEIIDEITTQYAINGYSVTVTFDRDLDKENPDFLTVFEKSVHPNMVFENGRCVCATFTFKSLEQSS
jgi:hypothetical protein